MDHVQIGVMPFGTGNDLARSLGFGGTAPTPLLGARLGAFRTQVTKYSKCESKVFDVWRVTMVLRPEGLMETVEHTAGKSGFGLAPAILRLRDSCES